jgi:maltokinase
MAEILDATLTPTKPELVQAWIGAQRWYAGKGRVPELETVFAYRFDDPAGEVGVETLLVRDASAGDPEVYQVPLTYRGAPVPELEHALVGTLEHSVLGQRWVYDGCHDPVYAACLLDVLQGRAPVASSRESDTVERGVTASLHPRWDLPVDVATARVLTGEQSNTSIIIHGAAPAGSALGPGLMAKVFRRLAAGHNPDVELQSALITAGCDRVPATMGALSGTVPLAPAGAAAYVDLVFVQELLSGVEDAWRVASRAVASDTDFRASARGLGAATAEVHQTLARTFGTEPAEAGEVRDLLAQMRSRFADACAEAPELERFTDGVTRVLAAAEQVEWPDLQRIHGDYHLGQVLQSPERGWILLDFEGEPMRPLDERRRPDQWVRDVAGMLRSIDYAGGSWEQATGRDARAWVEQTQSAFLDGYAEQSGADPRQLPALLAAFSLDKAMYEVVYEARNRPDWIRIPLDAVRRLCDLEDQ